MAKVFIIGGGATGSVIAHFLAENKEIGKNEWKNAMKMTMPGRFKLHSFFKKAADAGCKYAVIEVTSEGIKQYRHIGIDFYMAILTNVTPEHIESHGTFENYRAAKGELFKKANIHILNGEDPSIEYFLKINSKERVVYSKKDLQADFHLKLPGEFNIENAVAAYHAACTLGVDREVIKKVLEGFEFFPGRMEFVAKKPFSVVVDYAHTPDALEKVYKTLRHGGRLICVLGSVGGGRDKWKRPEMGKIAAKYCDRIILTNEDPYDEDPNDIIIAVEGGVIYGKSLPTMEYKKILDRREAIFAALKMASAGDIVIITGKGAEPWLMGPNGEKTPWDEREVVREELKNIAPKI